MSKMLNVTVKITKPPSEYIELFKLISSLGDRVGKFRYRNNWRKKLQPSEEKLRIWTPPKYSNDLLEIKVLPYQWSELQKNREIQPIGKHRDNDPTKYLLNAVVLTINAVIETSDNQLIFHKKKGGAKHGSIHTFGGYVSKKDIIEGDISPAIIRELGEASELELKEEEIDIKGFFGTKEGMPVILWDYGTGAIYSLVKINLTAKELEKKLQRISGSESLEKKLYKLNKKNVEKLLKEENIHPQTKLVIPTIIALYKNCSY